MKHDKLPDIGSERQRAADDFERRYGRFGGREVRGGFALESDMPFTGCEVRDSGAGGGQFTITGHAAVFNLWSLDLGGFRERILPGFFDEVLSRNPDVFHVWDHDTRLILSRTHSKTLELSITSHGLSMWSRVAPTSYAADLRVLMERDDINQSSFAFTVAKDEWRILEEDGEEIIERDLIRCGELYDVTTCAMGAYPQTDSQMACSKALDYARQHGRLPRLAGAENVAPSEGVSESQQGSRSARRLQAKAQAGRRNYSLEES